MKISSILPIISIATLTGCEFLLDYKVNTFDFKSLDHESRLCVYARFYADSGLQLRINKTWSLSDTTSHWSSVWSIIPEVNVKLLNTGNPLCLDTSVVLNQGKAFIGIEEFLQKPSDGDTLSIIVTADGFDPVKGSTIVPIKVPIDTLTVESFSMDTKMYRFTLFFTDPEPENYYFVSSVYHLTTYRIPVPGYNTISDTTYDNIRMRISLTDPVFDFMPDTRTSVQEPFDNSTRKPRIFSDQGIKNRRYGLNIEVPESDADNTNQPYLDFNSSYEVELYSISKELFETFKSSYLNEIIEGDIYAEPVFIYSNMSNKVGFFGAYGRKAFSSVIINRGDVLYYRNMDFDLYL